MISGYLSGGVSFVQLYFIPSAKLASKLSRKLIIFQTRLRQDLLQRGADRRRRRQRLDPRHLDRDNSDDRNVAGIFSKVRNDPENRRPDFCSRRQLHDRQSRGVSNRNVGIRNVAGFVARAEIEIRISRTPETFFPKLRLQLKSNYWI